MKSNKELKALIESIKTGAKVIGYRVTNESIATAVGIQRSQLQKYLSGSEKIQDDTFNILSEKFKKELSGVNMIGDKKPTYEQALLKVMVREMAKLKAKVENIDYQSALDDIDDKVELLMS